MFHIGIATQHPPLPDPSQMSDLGIDFIEQCVTLDPTDRPSAVELIKHPWLTPMVDAMVRHPTLTSSVPLAKVYTDCRSGFPRAW
jgi:mitogen-activated protein kinase kinase kinase